MQQTKILADQGGFAAGIIYQCLGTLGIITSNPQIKPLIGEYFPLGVVRSWHFAETLQAGHIAQKPVRYIAGMDEIILVIDTNFPMEVWTLAGITLMLGKKLHILNHESVNIPMFLQRFVYASFSNEASLRHHIEQFSFYYGPAPIEPMNRDLPTVVAVPKAQTEEAGYDFAGCVLDVAEKLEINLRIFASARWQDKFDQLFFPQENDSVELMMASLTAGRPTIVYVGKDAGVESYFIMGLVLGSTQKLAVVPVAIKAEPMPWLLGTNYLNPTSFTHLTNQLEKILPGLLNR